MKRINKCLSAAAAVMCCAAMVMPFGEKTALKASAIDLNNPISSDRYGNNMGDSFIDEIGTRNGNLTVDGVTYDSGIELWVARYNYKDEKSWAWASYKVDPSETEFKGTLSVLKDSYNTKNYNTTLEISVDGNIVYTYTMTPGFAPQEINISLKDASEIKFYVYDNEAHSGGTSFCIGTGIGYLLGDVDNSGAADAVDASLVLSAYARKATGGLLGFDERQLRVGDINKDEAIDSVDASLILSYYAYKATGGKDIFEDFLK